jgi:hypothetical protein
MCGLDKEPCLWTTAVSVDELPPGCPYKTRLVRVKVVNAGDYMRCETTGPWKNWHIASLPSLVGFRGYLWPDGERSHVSPWRRVGKYAEPRLEHCTEIEFEVPA